MKRSAASASNGKPVKKKQKSISTLDSFFASPSKGKSTTTSTTDVIEIDDSDAADSPPSAPVAGPSKPRASIKTSQEEEDAAFAARLAAEDEDQLEADEVYARKLAKQPVTPSKPVHPMFASAKREPPTSDVKGKGKAKDSLQSSPKVASTPFGSTIKATNGPVATEYPLDKDILDFQPARDVDTSTWPKDGQGKLQVPYAFLTAAFVAIGGTSKRLLTLNYLVNTLRTIMHYQPDVLLPSVYLITNHVAPAYEGVELGLGGQVLNKALKDVSGASSAELSKLWNKYGDAGDVAFEAKSTVRTLMPAPPLTLSFVYSTLVRIAGLKGQGVTQQKAALVQKVLVAAKGEEMRYIMRTFVSHLRIGAVRLTVTAAIARAFCLTRADGREAVEAEVSKGKKRARSDDESETFWIPVVERKGLKALAKTNKEGKADPKRLAIMATLERAEALVREVYVRHPNYSHIIPALLDVGLDGLAEAVPLAVGTPLSPMLGEITRDLGDVANRLNADAEFAAEWKYDGQRVQIHARRRGIDEPIPKEDRLAGAKSAGGRWIGEDKRVYIRLFSRHLEDMTDKYPDIHAVMVDMLEQPRGSKPIDSVVIDAEICAIDQDTGALLDFQTLSNRARKDVDLSAVKVRVQVFAFDLMHLNGRSLLSESFRTRRQLLHETLPPYSPADPSVARWDHVKSLIGSPADLAPIREFMAEAISNRCEGLMCKILDAATVALPATAAAAAAAAKADEIDVDAEDVKGKGSKGRRKALMATYEPDKRVQSWLKVKKDYGDAGDSLDVVPIGAWHGQGRKAGWWSPLLLALYDPETGGYQAVCKCISGFTDQFYKDLNVRYALGSETCTFQPQAECDVGGMVPQVWFRPSEVWEIRNADITRSPVYNAAKGLVPGDRGLSVRFPRFIKLREDKSVEQATTPSDLAAAWHRQESAGGSTTAKSDRPARLPKGSDGEDDEEDEDEEELYDVMEE